jgi:hypothetical protein
MKIHTGVGYSPLFPPKVRDYSAVPSSRRSNNLIGQHLHAKKGVQGGHRVIDVLLYLFVCIQ